MVRNDRKIDFQTPCIHLIVKSAHLASSSEMDGVVLHSVSLRDLLRSDRTSAEKFSLAAAPTTSGNVKVANEAEGAGGERASLESGG